MFLFCSRKAACSYACNWEKISASCARTPAIRQGKASEGMSESVNHTGITHSLICSLIRRGYEKKTRNVYVVNENFFVAKTKNVLDARHILARFSLFLDRTLARDLKSNREREWERMKAFCEMWVGGWRRQVTLGVRTTLHGGCASNFPHSSSHFVELDFPSSSSTLSHFIFHAAILQVEAPELNSSQSEYRCSLRNYHKSGMSKQNGWNSCTRRARICECVWAQNTERIRISRVPQSTITK